MTNEKVRKNMFVRTLATITRDTAKLVGGNFGETALSIIQQITIARNTVNQISQGGDMESFSDFYATHISCRMLLALHHLSVMADVYLYGDTRGMSFEQFKGMMDGAVQEAEQIHADEESVAAGNEILAAIYHSYADAAGDADNAIAITRQLGRFSLELSEIVQSEDGYFDELCKETGILAPIAVAISAHCKAAIDVMCGGDPNKLTGFDDNLLLTTSPHVQIIRTIH